MFYLEEVEEEQCICASAHVFVMGVFPSVEDFQGLGDNVKFRRGMPPKGSFLSPDSITSFVQFPAPGPSRIQRRLHLDCESGTVLWVFWL